jgi:hypothetical protein
VFNKDILGFKSELLFNGLTNIFCKTSKSTTHAYKIKVSREAMAGDVIRYIRSAGSVKIHNLSTVSISENWSDLSYDCFLKDPVDGINVNNSITKQGDLCVDGYFDFIDRIIRVYSNYDMQLQYIPADPNNPTIQVSREPISMADVSVIKPAINVSFLRNIEGFIGRPKVVVKVMTQATSTAGDGLASILYRQVKGDTPLPTIAADGDIATILHVDIAGRTFQSVVWQGNGTNLNNRELVFTEPSTGETFSINTKDLNSDITTLQSTIDTLAKPIERLLSSTEFAQVRDLDIDNSSEDIIDDSGRVIGNVKDMTVALNSTDFSNKQFEDFIIVPDPDVLGKTLFIATINDQEFVCMVRDTELKEGKSLTFNASNRDTLTINISKGGINSLSGV